VAVGSFLHGSVVTHFKESKMARNIGKVILVALPLGLLGACAPYSLVNEVEKLKANALHYESPVLIYSQRKNDRGEETCSINDGVAGSFVKNGRCYDDGRAWTLKKP
jgi:hypothetical protein